MESTGTGKRASFFALREIEEGLRKSGWRDRFLFGRTHISAGIQGFIVVFLLSLDRCLIEFEQEHDGVDDWLSCKG